VLRKEIGKGFLIWAVLVLVFFSPMHGYNKKIAKGAQRVNFLCHYFSVGK
jgi:hypothetical protein